MLIAPNSGNLHKIVVLNPKGGCGKTTLSTNIAACYSLRGPPPTLVDLDPKGFSNRWLRRRSTARPRIYGRGARHRCLHGQDAIQLATHADTETMIIDLPAALTDDELQDVTYDAGSIIIPVLPSTIDVVCASHFIADLLLVTQLDRYSQRLAVVANRTRRNTKSYEMLLRFLASLHIPMISVIRDSQSYVHAAARGIGVCELPFYLAGRDIADLQRIIDWVEKNRALSIQESSPMGVRSGPAVDDLRATQHK